MHERGGWRFGPDVQRLLGWRTAWTGVQNKMLGNPQRAVRTSQAGYTDIFFGWYVCLVSKLVGYGRLLGLARLTLSVSRSSSPDANRNKISWWARYFLLDMFWLVPVCRHKRVMYLHQIVFNQLVTFYVTHFFRHSKSLVCIRKNLLSLDVTLI